MLLLSVSFIHQTGLWVQSERTARCMQKPIKLSSFLLKNIRHRPHHLHFAARTITMRVMAKFAPDPVAHPAAARVPQLVRKYLAAVQRDVVHFARANGNCLRTTEMPSSRYIPRSSCSQDQLSPYELYVVAAILCYTRQKSWDLNSLCATWRRKLVRPPPCQVLPFPLSSLPQLLWLFYMRLFIRLIILKITVSEAQLWNFKAFLSTKAPLSEVFGTQLLCI